MYAQHSIPTSVDKAGVWLKCGKRLGAWLDGEHGYICLPESRLSRLGSMILWLITESKVTRKAAQIVAGLICHALQFRKEASAVVFHLWKFIGSEPWPIAQRALPAKVGRELLLVCTLLPLLRLDLRVRTAATVTVSDACESGGGLCASQRLTSLGLRTLGRLASAEVGASVDELCLLALCDGIGGGRESLNRLGAVPALYLSSEIDPRCQKLIRHHWPEVVELGDVRNITREELLRHLSSQPRINRLLVVAGPPCQDLSGLNIGGQGLSGSKSCIFYEVLRVIKIVRVIAKEKGWQMGFVIENVASMDSAPGNPRAEMSALLGCRPWRLCSSEVSMVKRPRYYWTDHEVEVSNEFRVQSDIDRNLLTAAEPWRKPVSLERGGARFAGYEAVPFLTFVRGGSKKAPGFHPAGLNRCSEKELSRWEADKFRFPPYQYCDRNMVWDGRCGARQLEIGEKEVLMGYRRGHTAAALSRSELKNKELERDVRHALIGNTFSLPSLDLFVGSWLVSVGLRKLPPRMQELHGDLAKQSMPQLEKQLHRWQDLGITAEEALVRSIFRFVSYRGGEIRRGCLTIGHPNVWPRQALDPRLWSWRIKVHYKKSDGHINFLELYSIFVAYKWRYRQAQDGAVRSRFLHLTDSQVSQSVASKGRAGSASLNAVLRRMGAMSLGLGWQCALGYVRSADNPADGPSRW
jgi:hypothetical protein